MTMMKRIAALALALVLTMSLAACGGMSEGSRTDGIFYEATGVSPDAVLMRVDGSDVTAESYFYQLYNMVSNLVMYCGVDGFDMDSGNGSTFGELCREYTMQSVKEIAMVKPFGEKSGLSLSEEQIAQITEEISSYESEYGEFGFRYMGVTKATMEEMYNAFAWYDVLEQSVYVEGGALAPADEDLLAYAEQSGLMKADHILLATQDLATGAALDEAAKQAQYVKAEDILATLQAAEDLESAFATLADENSEDTGRAVYPDGYVFGAGEMVAEFENAAKELAPGEISGIVESQFGYHILLRKELSAEEILAQGDYFAYLLKQNAESVKVEYSDLFNEKVANLDLGAFYTAVTDARDALYTEYLEQQEAENAAGGAEGESAGETEEAVG